MTAAGHPRRSRLAGALIATMIVLSVGHALLPWLPGWPAGIVAWSVGALLLPSVSRYQRVQVAVMGLVGLAGIALAAAAGDMRWGATLLEGNHTLLAMLAGVSFLRVVTRTGAAPGEHLPRGRGALYRSILATHLFSAIINISAVFVIGQRIADEGRLSTLQAKLLSRAFVAAACWSPLFAAMAVVLHYVPGTNMLAVSVHNLPLAAALLAWTAWDLGRDPTLADFVGSPVHREALTVPAVLSMLVVALHAWAEGWSILTVIIVGAASCVCLLRVGRPLVETRRLLRQHVLRELPRMGGEFTLFLGAAVLAAGIAALARVYQPDIVLDPVHCTSTIPLFALLVALTLVGIHPVISAATMSGLFPTSLSAPDTVAAVVLMAWSVALGTAPISGATLALQGRFGIPSVRFLRWNLPFTLCGLVCGSLLLALFDR